MIPKNSYNPSLIRFQDRLLLSYRFHDRADWRTSLAIADLDASFRSICTKPFLPPDELKENSWEDSRLFTHQGRLWMSATVSQWPATQFRSIVAYGQLLEVDDHWKLASWFVPNHAGNDFTGLQKNWVFLS